MVGSGNAPSVDNHLVHVGPAIRTEFPADMLRIRVRLNTETVGSGYPAVRVRTKLPRQYGSSEPPGECSLFMISRVILDALSGELRDKNVLSVGLAHARVVYQRLKT